MNKINGGFFWNQDDHAVEFNLDTHVTISNCVFYGRPRWWQIVAWYRALKHWLALPHSVTPTAPPDISTRNGRPIRWELRPEGVRWFYTDEA